MITLDLSLLTTEELVTLDKYIGVEIKKRRRRAKKAFDIEKAIDRKSMEYCNRVMRDCQFFEEIAEDDAFDERCALNNMSYDILNVIRKYAGKGE